MTILSIVFFVLAAVCNALMDTIQFHWYKFRWKDKVNVNFWNPITSWKNKYIDKDIDKGLRHKGWLSWLSNFTDAWHILKMIMIVSFALSIILFPYLFKINIFDSNFLNGVLWLIIYGLAWNISFNYCYNTLFVIKNKINRDER